jgi:heme exporter protein C
MTPSSERVHAMRQRVLVGLIIVSCLLTTVAFLIAFFLAEPAQFGTVQIDAAKVTSAPGGSGATEPQAVEGNKVTFPKWDMGQKIFYFHVPVAISSFLVFAFAAGYALRFLRKKDRESDTKSRMAMEVTLFFVVVTMATGILWTRWAWGVWWEWEPRLTTYFIMTLLVIAYFVLRSSVEDEERRATYASVFAIIAFIDAPISALITRLIPSNHPVIERGGLSGYQLAAFLIAMAGMVCLGYVVYQLRMREELVRERLEAVKLSIGG